MMSLHFYISEVKLGPCRQLHHLIFSHIKTDDVAKLDDAVCEVCLCMFKCFTGTENVCGVNVLEFLSLTRS